MERIVQLRDDEYNHLSDLAQLNDDKIQAMAKSLWEEKGVARVDVNIYTQTGYDSNFSIYCRTNVFCKDDKFEIPDEILNNIGDIINDSVTNDIRNRFGEFEDVVTALKKKKESLTIANYYLWGLVITGWLALAGYILLS